MGHARHSRGRFLSLVKGAGLGAAVLASMLAGPALAGAAAGASTVWSFHSAPDLKPPKLRVLKREPGLAAGDFLVANLARNAAMQRTDGQPGPMILDSRARPLWFLDTGGSVLDFEQESYQRKPVLVWVQGTRRAIVVNEHYRLIASLTTQNPWTIDGHDVAIVGRDIWVTVVRVVFHQNLTAYGGPADGRVVDSGVQEYQLSTGRLIRTWDPLNPGATPNVPLAASYVAPPWRSPWLAYHLNSVQPLPDGRLLVSMRNTGAVYLVDPVTGHVLWTLGGKRSTFTLSPDAQFAWQHDPRLVQPSSGGLGEDVELTLFNDDNNVGPDRPSAAMILRLNTVTRRATLVRAYRHQPAVEATALGSLQLLPNGNALVGWGTAPFFSEYSSSGKPLLDVEWPEVVGRSYRALLTDTWVGTPYYPPAGATDGRTVYASWNGATRVASWEVLAGPRVTQLTEVATAARQGFETAIALSRRYRDYEVRALDSRGHSLGTSPPFG